MQSKPLTPRSYSALDPPPPQTEIICPICTGRTSAEVFALRRELRDEREDAARERRALQRIIDALKADLATERIEHGEQYRRLQSKIEVLEQTLATHHTTYQWPDVESDVERKRRVLAAVVRGDLCKGTAAPPAEIRAKAAAKIEKLEGIESHAR